jgi:pimeloyl-ACP methyl ester carboxylesterase
MATTQTIIFVPGFWEGPAVFNKVAEILEKAGFATEMAPLVSTGQRSPGNPTMKDDIAAIRKHIEPIVDADKEVILVLHSAGGFLGSEAVENLELSKREANGKKGGVVKIIFVAAGVAGPGYQHHPVGFEEYDVSLHQC